MNFSNLNNEVFAPIGDALARFRLSVFLIMCFVLGGTSQDIVRPKLVLYLVSLVIIGGCLTSMTMKSRIWKMKSLIGILGVFFLSFLLYLVPLPPSLWSGLPGRDFIAQGFQTLGAEIPWLPLSTTPEKTFFSLFDFLPPFALIMLMGTVVKAKELKTAFWCVGAFVIVSVTLGILQVSSVNSDLYLYDITNNRSAVGFFSNANHLGVFLLMTIPFAMCLSNFSEYHISEFNKGQALSVICILAALIGVGTSGSLGSYLLIIPVLTATYFIWSPRIKKNSIYLFGIFGSLVGAFLFDLLLWGNLQQEILDKFTSIDATTRQTMFSNTYDIAQRFFPFGSGPGSFSDVYRLVEEAGRKTIPHAHNDYIEILSEFGVFGLAWMILGMLWITKNIWIAFRSKQPSNKIAKYISIAIATVLVHSVVDYSMRTISVMTLMVLCLCVLTLSNSNIDITED